jgi:hypothetical protein
MAGLGGLGCASGRVHSAEPGNCRCPADALVRSATGAGLPGPPHAVVARAVSAASAATGPARRGRPRGPYGTRRTVAATTWFMIAFLVLIGPVRKHPARRALGGSPLFRRVFLAVERPPFHGGETAVTARCQDASRRPSPASPRDRAVGRLGLTPGCDPILGIVSAGRSPALPVQAEPEGAAERANPWGG